MNSMIVLVPVAAMGLIGACGLLWRQLLALRRDREVSVAWLNRFSIARYKPMERLLSEDDFRFLGRQRGYQPEIAKQLRRERRRAFRSYLMCLKRDFSRLEAAVLLCMSASQEDRPDLARALVRRRLVFMWAVTWAEIRLAMYAFGPPRVNVEGLLGSLQFLRGELSHMALARQTSA